MIFLGLFVFLLAFIAFYRKKNTRLQNEVEEAFWEREYKANTTRRQDISGLPYLTIPLDKFPIGICRNDCLNEYEETLTSLAERKILNLGAYTNTDLKLKYGASNLNILSECDQNFTILCRTLVSYAKKLIELGHESEALPVLEYGISIGSDVSANYLILAGLYQKCSRTEDIQKLLGQAGELDSLMKDSIVKKLSALLNA